MGLKMNNIFYKNNDYFIDDIFENIILKYIINLKLIKKIKI
jgi:hypothetical protein